MYIKRSIEKEIIETSKSFQVVAIYGPRQVGKSTCVNHLFGDEVKQVTLDDFDALMMAKTNPKQFLEFYSWPLIIDEIQKAPELLAEIKINVDNERLRCIKENDKRKLMYVLTGSNRFELQQGISESLAGRCGIIEMNSFSMQEIENREFSSFSPFEDDILKREKDMVYKTKEQIFNNIFIGGMPDVVLGESSRQIYFKSYVDTYIEKDVKKLISTTNEIKFRNFISILALRTAQEINYNEISNIVGIDVDTTKRWLSILVSSGIIIFLQPYMSNLSKRIVKAPKMYFLDTGLASYLCKWPNAEMLESSAMSGAFFETYVVSEIYKSLLNNSMEPKNHLYYYRDIDKKEIDLIFEIDNSITPIEIKTNLSPSNPTKNFSVLNKFNVKINKGIVIDSCDKIHPINDNAFVVPVSLL